MNLDQVQELLGDWLTREFYPILTNPASLRERALRVLEEATELAQACGISETDIWTLIQRSIKRPKGDWPQEIAQVAITSLAFCESAGYSLQSLAFKELKIILNRSPNYYTARMAHKVLDLRSLYDLIEVNRAKDYLESHK